MCKLSDLRGFEWTIIFEISMYIVYIISNLNNTRFNSRLELCDPLVVRHFPFTFAFAGSWFWQLIRTKTMVTMIQPWPDLSTFSGLWYAIVDKLPWFLFFWCWLGPLCETCAMSSWTNIFIDFEHNVKVPLLCLAVIIHDKSGITKCIIFRRDIFFLRYSQNCFCSFDNIGRRITTVQW